jgi:hypothetical protein
MGQSLHATLLFMSEACVGANARRERSGAAHLLCAIRHDGYDGVKIAPALDGARLRLKDVHR